MKNRDYWDFRQLCELNYYRVNKEHRENRVFHNIISSEKRKENLKYAKFVKNVKM